MPRTQAEETDQLRQHERFGDWIAIVAYVAMVAIIVAALVLNLKG